MINNANEGFAIEYLNYTNHEYKVQFQYPADSILVDQAPSKMMVFSNSSSDAILLNYVFDFSVPQWFGTSDLELATNRQFETSRTESEYPVLEYMSPWITNIGGHKAGTYILTTKGSETDEDKEKIFKQQEWLIYMGPHGYYLYYFAPADIFDSREGTEFRNHFLNSVRFLE